MARFRITNTENNGHYLKTDPPTEWEQVEVDQKTGKQGRHRYIVPMFLDPKDPGTHNYPELGSIIVSTKADPMYPRDIVFLGPPTAGMEPLDAEAEALMRKVLMGSIHPISEAAFPTSVPQVPPVPDRFDEFARQMQAQMAGLIGHNEQLMRKVAELEESKLDLEPLPRHEPPPPPTNEVRL